MPSTEERLRKLIADNLEVDGKPIADVDMSNSLRDIGVSSVDVLAFARVVQQEFGIQFGVEQCTELKNLNEVIAYVDANAG